CLLSYVLYTLDFFYDIVFFVSSRRRHTSSKRDWSSDVCSSDLNSSRVRIPSDRGMGTRLELRSADPSSNPYLAIAAVLEAGLDGLRNNLPPIHNVDENIYTMTKAERAEKDIHDLPDTLHNALKSLANDEVIKSTMGKHLYNSFMEAKTREYAS